MTFCPGTAAAPTVFGSAVEKTMPEASALKRELSEEFAAFKDEAKENHLSSPIRQLALGVSRRVHGGKTSVAQLQDLIQLLTANAFEYRARRLAHYVGECGEEENAQRIRELFDRLAHDPMGNLRPYADFAARVEAEVFGIVITAHPTFAVSEELTKNLAMLATGVDEDGRQLTDADVEALAKNVATSRHGSPERVELGDEQHFALMAIGNIHKALHRIYALALEVAEQHYPDDWESLTPRILTVASWVGYDLDGRSDIGWSDSLFRRMEVELLQLERYRDTIEGLGNGNLDALRSRLEESAKELAVDIDLLGKLGDDVEKVGEFGRRLAGSMEHRLIDTAELIEMISTAMASVDSQTKHVLAVLRAEMANFGLAFAHTHVRLNASQLTNAIRSQLDLEGAPIDAVDRRRYMRMLNDMIEKVEPVSINFGSVMSERTSAKRLFMLVTQFLKYVDSAEPVRFLIAETNTAFTVMTALYYAKLFGVEDKIDISPLFETAHAMQHGHEIVSELLDYQPYRDYVAKRGRLCIQMGFSDAGRFVGQVPATLAIERIRIKLARVLEKKGVDGVSLVIFDTHGESFGRGAHPLTFHDRLDYTYPPASRAAFVRAGIPVKQEVSFQGGDGYVYFATPAMAFATVSRLVEHALRETPGEMPDDEFYQDTDFSLEFFMTIKNFNEGLVDNPDYGGMLNLFGPSLLFPTGSRKVKRQNDSNSGNDQAHPSQTRAIPHNAVLQQIGYMSNSISGIGKAISRNHERFVEVAQTSDRLRRFMAMVTYARNLSNLDVLYGYVSLYDPSVWLRRAAIESDPRRVRHMQRLARLLRSGRRQEQLNRVNRIFLNDTLELDAGLKDIGACDLLPEFAKREDHDLSLLHAVRVSLIHEIFLLVTRIPRFSNQSDATIDEVIDELLQLDVEHAINILKRAFPLTPNQTDEATFGEPATYAANGEEGYEREHRELFDPIMELYDLVRRSSNGITHFLGAVG